MFLLSFFHLVNEGRRLLLVPPDLTVQRHHHPRLSPFGVRREELIRKSCFRDKIRGTTGGRGGGGGLGEVGSTLRKSAGYNVAEVYGALTASHRSTNTAGANSMTNLWLTV